MKPFNDTEEVLSAQSRKLHRNAIIGAVLIFALIIVGMFIFAFLKKEEIKNTAITPKESTPTAVIPYPTVTRIDATHYFIDGVHTLVGEVDLPTPCDLLESDATVQESDPEQITIAFSVLNNSETCIQQITQQRFKVSAKASVNAQITVTFMGRPIELNLIPAPKGELPKDFELFIKG